LALSFLCLSNPFLSHSALPWLQAPADQGAQTKEPVKVRYGYHLVTDCRKANQGNKSHKDVEATIIHHFNTYTSITATKAKPFTNRTTSKQTSSARASPPSTTRRPGTCISTSRLRTPWGSPTRSSSTVLPLATSRARVNTILATRSSPAQSARRSSNTTSTTPFVRQRGLTFIFRARDDGRARGIYRDGVLCSWFLAADLFAILFAAARREDALRGTEDG
jgi:hypothetical protein